MNTPHTKPVLEFKRGKTTIRLYALNPGERLTRGRYSYCPSKTCSMVYETEGPAGYRIEEQDLRDANLWEWIGKLMQDGFEK